MVNYDMVKKRYGEKIHNFNKSMNRDNNMLIFITCVQKTTTIKDLRISPFYIFIFTNEKVESNSRSNMENVAIINLKNIITDWWCQYELKNGVAKWKSTGKEKLFGEAYTKFIETLQKFGIEHNFPITYDLVLKL